MRWRRKTPSSARQLNSKSEEQKNRCGNAFSAAVFCYGRTWKKMAEKTRCHRKKAS
jgi:hypothetical protein